MKCAEVHPNLAAFALGGLEAEETAEIRRHLDFCPDCQSELEELRKVNRALDAAPPPAVPPSYLKEEILSRVRAEGLPLSSEKKPEERSSSEEKWRSHRTSRFNRFRHLRFDILGMAAAALVAVVALGITFSLLREPPPVASIQLVPTAQEATWLKGYWGVAELRPQPSGNQQVELRLNNLDEPKPNSYYELWFVSGDKRISAGSFTSVGQGETRVVLSVPPEARNYHTILLTEEHIDNDGAPSQEVALRGVVPQ